MLVRIEVGVRIVQFTIFLHLVRAWFHLLCQCWTLLNPINAEFVYPFTISNYNLSECIHSRKEWNPSYHSLRHLLIDIWKIFQGKFLRGFDFLSMWNVDVIFRFWSYHDRWTRLRGIMNITHSWNSIISKPCNIFDSVSYFLEVDMASNL